MDIKEQTAVVCSAGGSIGLHLVKSLPVNKVKVAGAVDIKPLEVWYQVTDGVETLSLTYVVPLPGSSEPGTVDQLVGLAEEIAGIKLKPVMTCTFERALTDGTATTHSRNSAGNSRSSCGMALRRPITGSRTRSLTARRRSNDHGGV